MFQPKNTIIPIKPTRSLIINRIEIQKDKVNKAMIISEKEQIKHYALVGEIKSSSRRPLFEQKVIDEIGFQATNSKITTYTNTPYLVQCEKIIQTEFEIVRAKMDERKQIDVYMFIKENLQHIEDALVQNEFLYLYQNPLKKREKKLIENDGQNQALIKVIKSFDYEKLQNYGVSSLDINGSIQIMAVSYKRNLSFSQKFQESNVSSQSFVLVWNIGDLSKFIPQAILKSPVEIQCLKFCPNDPYILIACGENGQLFLYDLKSIRLIQEKNSNQKKISENEEIQIMQPVVQSLLFDSQSISISLSKRDFINRKPYINFSHKNKVIGIQFFPKEFNSVFKKKNLYTETTNLQQENQQRNQLDIFATFSQEGDVVFWSLDFSDPKEPQDLSIRQVEPQKVQWKPFMTMQLSLIEMKIQGVQSLHFQVEQENIMINVIGTNQEIVQLKFDTKILWTEDSFSGNFIKQKWSPQQEENLVSVDFHMKQKEFILLVSIFSFKIYLTDFKDYPVYQSHYLSNQQNNCGCFSQQKSSLIFIGKKDGVLELWDLQESSETFSSSILISASGIDFLYNKGKQQEILYVGDKMGGVHLLQIPSHFLEDDQTEKKYWKGNKEVLKVFYIQNKDFLSYIQINEKNFVSKEEKEEENEVFILQEEDKKVFNEYSQFLSEALKQEEKNENNLQILIQILQ